MSISEIDKAYLRHHFIKSGESNSDGFIQDIEARIADEAVLTDYNDMYRKISQSALLKKFEPSFNPRDFTSYINHETHVAIEKAGWTWDGQSFKYLTTNLSDSTYYHFRFLVIRNFVEQALPILKTKRQSDCTAPHYNGCMRNPLTID